MALDIFLPKLNLFDVNTYYVIKYCGVMGNMVSQIRKQLFDKVGRSYTKVHNFGVIFLSFNLYSFYLVSQYVNMMQYHIFLGF